jgi:ribokinase
MSGRIVVVGSSNVDLIMKMDRLPQRGESVSDAVFMQTFGGKGANQAVAAAKAGGEVVFVNCVGDDSYGEQVVANLRQAGVDTRFVSTESGVSTGTALIMVGGQGENYLGVAPGANYRLGQEHVDQAKDLIAAAAMVVVQYEIRPETLLYAINLAAQTGCPVLFNLAPPKPLADEALARLEILVVNETEAAFLCGFPVEGEAQAWRAVQALKARGPRLVILTLGTRGCLFAGAQERGHIPAFPVEAVDTTAAGDVFCGTLAVALVEGQPVREGLRFASAAAAIAVTRMGAQPSIPDRDEIDAFLRGNRRKYE